MLCGLLHGRPVKQRYMLSCTLGLFPEVCRKTVLLPESFAPSAAMIVICKILCDLLCHKDGADLALLSHSPAFFIQSMGSISWVMAGVKKKLIPTAAGFTKNKKWAQCPFFTVGGGHGTRTHGALPPYLISNQAP